MPMLPSGRHVAVEFDRRIIEHLMHPDVFSVHWVMALQKPEDTYPWLKVSYLEPNEAPTDQDSFNEGSAALPENHRIVPTGLRLSQWETLTADWNEEDQCAMRAWMEGPMREKLVAPCLEEADTARKLLEASTEIEVQIAVGWWKAGVHFAQEENWRPE